MDRKEFKVKMNTATLIFLLAYLVYIVYILFTANTSTIITILVFGVLCFAFFLGMRPYKYSVEKKTVTIHYYLWKNRHIDLMQCETICDPISRWADLFTRPHAIELYTNTKKRYCFFPKQRVEFVDAIVRANKRIHCTVKEYTDVRRMLEKKERKERKKAEREAYNAKIKGNQM